MTFMPSQEMEEVSINDKIYYIWEGDTALNSNILNTQNMVDNFNDWQEQGLLTIIAKYGKGEYQC